MPLDVRTVVDLIKEMDSEDGIDWGMLNIDEDNAAEMLASSVIEHYENAIQPMTDAEKDYVIVAAIAKLTIENFVLNVKLAQASGANSAKDS